MAVKLYYKRLARNWITAVLDPNRTLAIFGLRRFIAHWRRFNKMIGSGKLCWQESYPCLTDWSSFTPFDPHYFYQGWWAARKLALSGPEWHVDIGSSITLISAISAWVPTLFVDYRPLKVNIKGFSSIAGELVNLPFASRSIPSMSSLHVIEHVGLGRYGDGIDPHGSVKAARELIRVLAPGGRLLLSAPIGRERVQFNAHRIFAPGTVLSMFGELELVDFDMVDDVGMFLACASPSQAANCEYACGMFEFSKRQIL